MITIDLSKFEKFEKRKNKFEKLTSKLEAVSVEINEAARDFFHVENFTNKDGSINSKAYTQEPYNKEEIEQDKLKIRELEMKFSSAQNPKVADFYKQKYGKSDTDFILKKWNEKREKQKSSRVEAMITILLHRILKEDFLIVKTNKFDDYKAGVDNLIIEKETGSIVGAFDGVAENDSKQNQTTRETQSEKKQNKVSKIAQKGGSYIKYGVKMESGKFSLSNIKNLPVFFLNITDAEFNTLANLINQDLSAEITETEKEIYSRLINSLSTQHTGISSLPNLNQNLKNNLEEFKNTLNKLKEKI